MSQITEKLLDGTEITYGDDLASKQFAYMLRGLKFSPTLSELRVEEYRKIASIDEIIEALIEAVAEKRPEKLEAIQKARLAVKEKIK